MKQILLLSFILISSCAYSQQVEDWIYFKDSTIVKGLVVEIKEGGIKVKTSEGMKEFRFYKIAKIVKQHPELMRKVAYSQTEKGTFKIGGLFSYSHVKYEIRTGFLVDGSYRNHISEYNYTSLQFSPSVMYFPIDNFGAGILFNIVGYTPENARLEYKYNAGINLQYYFASGGMRPFITSDVLYILNGDKGSYQFAGGGGLSFAISKNAALQPLIQYGRVFNSDSKSKDMFLYSLSLSYFLF